MTDVEEHRIESSQHDLDHLNAGHPVFKGIGEDVRLVLYSDAPAWQTIETMHQK